VSEQDLAPNGQAPAAPTQIVLATVHCERLVCIARRSALVTGSNGQWSVVTGYLDPTNDPLTQAWHELDEELGLAPPTLELRKSPPALLLTSERSGQQFLVHPFLFESSSRQVRLNWEHDAFDWVATVQLARPDFVGWQLQIVNGLMAD
jgi:8-oxo-dGTP pyrophosphatase MutT (NUDIX family)